MEKNCKTCGGTSQGYTTCTGIIGANGLCSVCGQEAISTFYQCGRLIPINAASDISPDLCCGITDSVVSQGEKREYITCAANWFNDGKEYLHQPTNIKEGFVVCGHRHHNVFMTVSLIRGEDFRVSDYGKVTQGFLTSHDRFVDREEAGVIAFREKQITKWTNCLFSEDLY